MSKIKWVRAQYGQQVIRKGFDDLCAEHNGASLFLRVYIWPEMGLCVAWQVIREPFLELSANGLRIFTLGKDVSDEELRKMYELAKKRAEAFANCWVEE